MKNFNINYYFKDIDENEIFYKLTNNKENVMDIFFEKVKFLEKVNKQIIKTNCNLDDVKIIGNVYIDENTIIESGSIIEGPVYIGKNCKVSYNSYIRPGTLIEDNCVIGFSTEVKNTIIRDGAIISDLAFVGDSIIGRNSRVGSGVIVSNRCFNQSNVTVKDELKNKYDLGREVMGIILGDNSRIGANCTTSPGTFIGMFTFIYPHTCIYGFIPSEKKVYDKKSMVFLDNEKQVLSKACDWDYSKYN